MRTSLILISVVAACGMKGGTHTADPAKLADEVARARRSLTEYDLAFKKGFTDRGDFIVALDTVKYLPPDQKFIYGSLAGLDPELTALVVDFTYRAGKITTNVRTHVDQTKKDFDLLKKGTDGLKAVQPRETENKERYSAYRYAVMLSIPTEEEAAQGKQFGARFVEIDLPICNDTNRPSPTGECNDMPSGFRYRADPAGAWRDGRLATPGAPVPRDELVLLLPSAIVNVLAQTPGPTLAELRYDQRVIELATEVNELLELGAFIEGELRKL